MSPPTIGNSIPVDRVSYLPETNPNPSQYNLRNILTGKILHSYVKLQRLLHAALFRKSPECVYRQQRALGTVPRSPKTSNTIKRNLSHRFKSTLSAYLKGGKVVGSKYLRFIDEGQRSTRNPRQKGELVSG